MELKVWVLLGVMLQSGGVLIVKRADICGFLNNPRAQ